LQPIDKLIETWKQLKAADRFVDSLEPIAYWCLRYQSTGGSICLTVFAHLPYFKYEVDVY